MIGSESYVSDAGNPSPYDGARFSRNPFWPYPPYYGKVC